MPKLTPTDEKRLEEQFRLISRQSHEDETKNTVKDYSLVIGTILLITGLMLAAIIYRFTPW